MNREPLRQKLRRLAGRCVFCADPKAPWVYHDERGREIRVCDWDNARVQQERVAVPVRRVDS